MGVLASQDSVVCNARSGVGTPRTSRWRPCRSYSSYQQLLDLVELDAFDDGLLDAQQGANILALRTAFSAQWFLTFDKPET